MFEAGAVIIAAGLSSRMGAFKPMLPLGNTTVIRKIIATLQKAGVEKIVVVTGYQAEVLEAHIADLKVITVRNERYAQSQMFDSAKIGFSMLVGSCRKVLFMPCDIPLFNADTVRLLLQQKKELVCPCWQNKKGHPIMIAENLLEQILHHNGDYGLHGAFANCGKKMELLPVEDWGIIYDMDTQKEYEAVKVMFQDIKKFERGIDRHKA